MKTNLFVITGFAIIYFIYFGFRPYLLAGRTGDIEAKVKNIKHMLIAITIMAVSSIFIMLP